MADDHDPSTEQLLLTAIESSPSGLLMVDRRGTIVLVNKEIERLFGYSRDELLAKPVEILVPAAHRERHIVDRGAYAAQPGNRAMGEGRDIVGLRKDGTEIPVEIGLTSVPTPNGLYIVSAIVDISARKQTEEEHRRLVKELHQAQKLEALGTLAGGVAHDFNNVLTAITGYSELVRDRTQDQEALQDLDQILAAAERGRRIVASILRYTRRHPSERCLTDLASPIREVASLLRSTIPGSIDVHLELSPDTPHVIADSTAIHRILVNLCNNAAQAMSTGDDRKQQTLTISLKPLHVQDSLVRMNSELREGPYALLEVTDTGSGMTPEVLEHLYEPFYTTKNPDQGTGLGLATVRALLRDHGGTIVIDSGASRGTCVRCFFPAGEVELPPLLEPAPGNHSPPGRGERICFVDDQPDLVQVGIRRLERLGYDVQGFTESRAALESITADPDSFDLLITDFSMPVMNGLALAQAALAVRPGLPILLVTGWTEHLAKDHLAAAGVRGLLLKPFTTTELARTVHTLLAEATDRRA